MTELKVNAPDFVGIKEWINSKPLTIDELKGKVVLIDFWTYTCINCIRTLPYLKRWHEKYAKSGLVIIGVHSPEFGFEKDVENVRKAVKDLGIQYAVAVDSDQETWDAYANKYWPSKYLIDKDGYVALVHNGEGDYSEIEKRIQDALGVKGKSENEVYQVYMNDQSPETYTGVLKNLGLGSGLACDKDGCNVYVDPDYHERDVIYPNGQWEQETDCLELKKAPGQLTYRFSARQVNVVMGPIGDAVSAQIMVDGKKTSSIKVDRYRMYTLYEEKKYSEHEITIFFDGLVKVYAYTFG